VALSAEQEQLVTDAEKSTLAPLRRGQLRAMAFGLVSGLTENERERAKAAARKQGSAK
jgi:hypothetical protein